MEIWNLAKRNCERRYEHAYLRSSSEPEINIRYWSNRERGQASRKLEWACGLYLCFLWDQGMATQQLESKADLRSWTKTGWCVSDEQKRTVMDGLDVEPWRRKVRTGRAPRSGSMPAQSECLSESLL